MYCHNSPFSCAVIASFLLAFPVLAQNGSTLWSETGRPLIQNFRPTDYHAGSSNYAIAQDERGLLYFGNNQGVLVFDGVRWQLVRTPGNATVRALCHAGGRIYVGTQRDFGYLAPDSIGGLHFVSLKPYVPEPHRDFRGIWEIVATEKAVFFRSYYAVFRWDGSTMRAWTPHTLFHNAYVAGNTFYVREHTIGLEQLDGDSLRLLPGGDQLAEETFAGLWRETDGRLRGITRFHGLWEYDGTRFKKITTPADSLLHTSLVFHAVRLPAGKIALATHHRGLALLDSSGHLLRVVDRAAGLRGNTANFVHADRQGGLWLALINGIARVELLSPFSYFNEITGLEEGVNAVARYRGRLYAATTLGVFVLNSASENSSFPRFEKVEGINSTAWYLLAPAQRLLAGTHRGVFSVDGRKATPVVTEVTGVTSLVTASEKDARVYVGQYRGAGLLEFLPGGETRFRKIPGLADYVWEMVVDTAGVLWVGGRQGLYAVQLADSSLRQPETPLSVRIARFGKEDGLPAGAVRPFRIDNELRFAARGGVYRFDGLSQKFLRDSLLTPPDVGSLTSITLLGQDSRGDVWLAGSRLGKFSYARLSRSPDGASRWDTALSNRLADLGELYAIFSDDDGVVWFGGAEGLLRYAPASAAPSQQASSALIRSVRTLSGDSLVFGGFPAEPAVVPQLPYALNSLRFDFAAPAYEQPEKNHYQYYLHGFDAGWSSWQRETRKEYTGLGPGEYTFHVRARDAYGRVSRADEYAFRILPPWYRQWWAWLLYFSAAAGLVALIIKVRVRHLKAKTRALEALIAERTATVREQAEQLQERDRLKSRFFANISHEFRTPLTLILGTLEDISNKMKQGKARDELQLVQRNARRLQRLINQLLDLSRLETGKMKLQVAPGDFIGFLRGVVMSFASLAESNHIDLKFEDQTSGGGPDSAQDRKEMYFDRDKVEKIFSNLLANALKFTPAGGETRVAVQEIPQMPRSLQVSISDNGRGIPAELLPFVFDRFYQIDGDSTGGSGIGLALVKELVELHRGAISVESRLGEGTTFTVILPLDRAHFHGEEIVAEAPLDEADKIPASSDVHDVGDQKQAGSRVPRTVDDDATVVLIVEDHAEVRHYLRQHLQDAYRIVEAQDGSEGVAMAQELIPDLVISDVMMPEQDGFALCAALKTDARTSHIPVILLTARAGEEDKLAGLEIGADDYLLKPFNAKELRARVRNLIEQRRALRQRFLREGMMQPSEVTATSLDDQFLQNIMRTIEARLADEHFSVEELSHEMNMTPRHLHRKLRALTGKTPVQLIRYVRLTRARQLLEQHAGTVSEIAYQVGFSNLSYFARVFREEFGRLPSEI